MNLMIFGIELVAGFEVFSDNNLFINEIEKMMQFEMLSVDELIVANEAVVYSGSTRCY